MTRVWLFGTPIFVVLVVVFFVIIPILLGTKGEVTIANDGREPIGGGYFIVCKQRFELGQIQPNERKQFTFKVNCEGDYDLNVVFSSGKKLSRKIGYVNSSFEAHDTVSIGDHDAILAR